MEGAKRASSFRSWSAAQGITTNGIDYCEIPNSGLGIVAKRRLEVHNTQVFRDHSNRYNLTLSFM